MHTKLQSPQTLPHFTHRQTIRISDLNHAAHLGHDAYLKLIAESRNEFFFGIGATELNVGENLGTVIASLAVEYHSEGLARQHLVTAIWVTHLGNKSMTLHYCSSIMPEGRLLATAETAIVCFDYLTKKTAQWPKRFLDSIQQAMDAL